ncbi:hypothetical protein ACE6H2_004462 [Prunus campanulata]
MDNQTPSVFFLNSDDGLQPQTKQPHLFGISIIMAVEDGSRFIDSTYQQKQSHVPSNFKWPEEDVVSAQQELNAPVVDLEGFFKGDVVVTENAAKLIRSSCLSMDFSK